ncbi:MAG TPA: hypothetical protein VK673_10735, partial [Chthoniobacterales bacterium]|nr:hypothetical protein [Chthoniobacterales bacterium]
SGSPNPSAGDKDSANSGGVNQSRSEASSELTKERQFFIPGVFMSQNLTLLRQVYCCPVVLDGPPDLFRLERESEQGKAILEKPAKRVRQRQEFDPVGLLQTYRDEQTGAELPVFAVFNLEGSNRLNPAFTRWACASRRLPRTSPDSPTTQRDSLHFLPIQRDKAKPHRGTFPGAAC